MSNQIDERGIKLTFENDKFESGVSKSLDSLEKLNKSLDFTDKHNGGRGLEQLNQTIKATDFSGMSDGIQKVAGRFTNLGIVGMTAIQNLTNNAVDAGTRIVKSLTISPVKMGFDEYELKMNSVRTIMASTGASVGEVNGYLDELNEYADNTIYSFSDMTENIGKFTNAGVGLKDAVNAIKGISNAAAVSGASANEASRAMFNFSQALSSGSVKLVDWMSIERANMATQDFKQQLLDTAVALGTVEKVGKKYRTTTVNAKGAVSELFGVNAKFRESLAHQWMTTEVLTKTLRNYSTDVANMNKEELKTYRLQLKREGYSKRQRDNIVALGKKANDAAQEVTTWSKMMDALQEAVQSGWARSFELIFGNIEEAKVLWTGINNVVSGFIVKMDDARNSMLETWKDAGGRQALLDGLADTFKYIGSLFKPIGDAYKEVFKGDMGKTLAELSMRFRDFAKGLKLSSDTARNIKDSFAGLFSVVKLIGTVIKGVIRTLLPATRAAGSFGGIIFSITGSIGRFLTTLTTWIQKTGVIQKAFKLLSAGVKTITGALRYLSERIVNLVTGFGVFSNGVLDKVVGLFAKLVIAAKEGVTWLGDKLYGAMSKYAAPAFEKLTSRVKGATLSIRDYLTQNDRVEKVTTALGRAGNTARESFRTFGVKMAEIFARIKSSNAIAKLKESFDGLGKVLKQLGASILKEITGSITSFINKIKELHILDKIVSGITKFVDKVKSIAKTINDTLHPVEEFKKLFDPKQFVAYGKELDDVSASVKAFGNTSVEAGNKNTAGNGIKKSVDGIISTLKESPIYKAIQDFKEKITISFGNFDMDKLINRGIGVTKVYATLKLVKQSGDLTKSISESFKGLADVLNKTAGAINSFSGFMSSMSGLATQAKKYLRIEAFKSIAISIALLAGSLYIISKIPAESLGRSMAALGGVLLALIVVLRLLSNNFISPAVLSAMAAGIGALAAALLAIAITAKILGSMSASTLAKAGAALVAYIAAIGLAGRIALESTVSMVGFMFVAAAMALLVPAILMMAAIPFGVMVKGGAAIFSFMLLMALAGRAASKDKVGLTAFLGMAAAVVALVPAILTLAMLPMDKALKAAVTLTLVMLALGTSVRIASAGEGGGNTFMVAAMAAMIVGLTTALIALSIIPAGKLFKAVAALSAVMLGIAGISYVMKAAEANVESLILVIGLIAGAVYLLASVDAGPALSAMTQIAALIVGLSVAMAVLDKAKMSGAGAAALPVVLAWVGVIIAVITAVSTIVGQLEGAEEALRKAQTIANLLGGVIGAFVGGIVGGLVGGLTVGLPIMATNLSLFMEQLKPFLSGLQAVDPVIADSAKTLAEAILYITGAQLMNAIATFLGGGGIGTFASDLILFMSDLGKISDTAKDALGKDPEAAKAAINTAADMMEALGKAAGKIPVNSGAYAWIAGFADLSEFGQGLDDLMNGNSETGAGGFFDIISKFKGKNSFKAGDLNIATSIADAITKLGEAAQKVPKTGGIDNLIRGTHDLSRFGYQIDKFLNGGIDGGQIGGGESKGFLSAMADINANADVFANIGIVEKIANAVKEMGEAAQKVPETGGIASLISGTKDLKEFAAGISDIVPAVSDAVSASSSLSEDSVTKIGFMATIIKSLAKAAAAIEVAKKAKSLIGKSTTDLINNLNKFAGKLSGFVPGFKKFATAAGGIKTADLKAGVKIASAIKSLAEANKSIKSVGGVASPKSFEKLSKGANAFVKSFKDIKTKDLVTKAKNFATAVKKVSDALAKTKQFSTSGKNAIKGFNDSLEGGADGASKAGTKVAKAAADAAGKQGKFKTAASNALEGYKSRLASSKKPASGGKTAGKNAADAAAKADFTTAGANGAQGFANGLRSKLEEVATAGTALGKAALDAAMKKLKEKSPSKAFMEVGEYADIGFVNGIYGLLHKVTAAGEDLGAEALNGAEGALYGMDDLMEPSITPVLDLSLLKRGVGRMDSMLNGTTATIGASIAGMNIGQNGGQTEDLINKIADLSTSIQTMSDSNNLDTDMVYEAVRQGASDAVFNITLNNRELSRGLRDMGVVFK